MITDDYVNFETAKLLEQKGFHEPCIGFYNYIGTYFGESAIRSNLSPTRDGSYNAPTLQMVLKWLREVHNIKVNVWYANKNVYAAEYWVTNSQTGLEETVFIGDNYNSYEKACESAIQYCLENLI
jgi:hypothetical protein